MFQEPLLLNATVYQNAALGLRLRGTGQVEMNGAWVHGFERPASHI